MPTNQYKPFATGVGANVQDPVTYAASAAVQTGVQPGIADPMQANTSWRQSSVMAAMIAQFIVDRSGFDAMDDGNIATLEANFITGINSLIPTFPTLPTTPVHVGDDSSSTASTITAVVSPTITSYATDHVYVIGAAHACAGATTAVIDGLPPRAVVRNDFSPVQTNDWLAGARLVLIDNGTNLSLVGLTSNQVLALATGTTTINTTTQTYIDKSTPRGSTKLSAFTANVVVNDIAQTPAFTTVQTTGNFTGATYVDCSSTCALHDNAGNTFEGSGTARIQINDLTLGTNAQSEYVGGGSFSQGTQVSLVVPRFIFNCTPSHTYNLQLVCQKGAGVGPAQIFDTFIFAQHDGTNL